MGNLSERRADGLLLTPRQVLEILGPGVVGKNRLYGWLRSGRLPAIRDGRKLLVARKAVDRLVAEIADGHWST
jgi:excisionase family DNA binding protein